MLAEDDRRRRGRVGERTADERVHAPQARGHRDGADTDGRSARHASILQTGRDLARLNRYEARRGGTARPRGVRVHRVGGRAGPGLADRQAGSSGRGPRVDDPSRGATPFVRRDGSRERRRAGPCPRARDRQARLVSGAARVPEGRAVAHHRAGRRRDLAARIRSRAPAAGQARRLRPADFDRPRARRHAAARREQPGPRSPRESGERARERARALDRPAVRGRPRSVWQRLRLRREPAAAPERQRAADDRGRSARRSRDRADRGRPERRRLLLDRDADLPAPGRFRAAHPDRRHRGSRWRR